MVRLDRRGAGGSGRDEGRPFGGGIWHCGADSLDSVVAHLVLLDLPFTVEHPPELADRCRAVAARLAAASP